MWGKFVRSISKVGINTWLLLLILMMMFGEYSQRYYHKASWGSNWSMETVAPFIYYASGTVAILLIIIIVVRIIIEGWRA